MRLEALGQDKLKWQMIFQNWF